MLEEWKKLPAYKLETRIDSFVGFALPGVLEELLYVKAQLIIPELPLRVGTIYPEREDTASANRSYKVDFYARCADGQNLFIEFISDSSSRREEQDEYLQIASELGMENIINGILALFSATPFKNKYKYLLDTLVKGGVLGMDRRSYIGDIAIKVIYLQPLRLPTDGQKEVIDFNQVADALRSRYGSWDLMVRFAESLETWVMADA